jgi:hypothetical protein
MPCYLCDGRGLITLWSENGDEWAESCSICNGTGKLED